MANAIDALDTCSRKLDAAQSVVKTAKTVVTVLAGAAMVGGLGLLMWKLFHEDPSTTTKEAKPWPG